MPGDYGHKKTKTMIKSILPSTARKSAKDNKDNLHRKNRRIVSTHFSTWRGPASYVEELYDDDNFDLDYYIEFKDADGAEYVYSRRAHDKLNHFEFWAYQKTKHLPITQRLPRIKAILPPGVIGDHALSHLRFLDGYLDSFWGFTEEDRLYYSQPHRMRVRRNNEYLRNQVELRNRLRDALYTIYRDDRKRKAFNKYLIEHFHAHGCWEKSDKPPRGWKVVETKEVFGGMHYRWEIIPRTLNGYHDIHKFEAEVWINSPLKDLVKRYFNI